METDEFINVFHQTLLMQIYILMTSFLSSLQRTDKTSIPAPELNAAAQKTHMDARRSILRINSTLHFLLAPRERGRVELTRLETHTH